PRGPLLHAAAGRLGLDPADIRRRNLVRPDEMPWDCGTVSFGVKTVYASGDFPALFERLLERLDYAGARAAQKAAGAKRLGIGLALYVGESGGGPFETE